MKNLFALLILSVTACAPISKEFKLFERNGENWIKGGTSSWTFENGELVGVSADSSAGFTFSNEQYGDFVLNLEFYPDSTINSGVFVRCINQELSFSDCYEINIWDLHPNQKNRTGSIVNRVSPLSTVYTLDKWNTYKIVCKENNIKAWINGIQTVDFTDDQIAEGYIGLQTLGSGTVKLRNVKIGKL